jgi:hypothetical protein
VPVSVGGAGWRTTSGTTYATSWERCSATGTACQAIAGATAASYTPTAADVGHTLVGVITATDVDGSVPSASAPSQVVLPGAPRLLRNDAGTPLAIAQVTGSATTTADALIAHARRAGPRGRVVRVRRARTIRGRLRAWVCPVGPARGAVRGTAPPSCTRQFWLRASALVRLPASMTGRVPIVVVRRR